MEWAWYVDLVGPIWPPVSFFLFSCHIWTRIGYKNGSWHSLFKIISIWYWMRCEPFDHESSSIIARPGFRSVVCRVSFGLNRLLLLTQPLPKSVPCFKSDQNRPKNSNSDWRVPIFDGIFVWKMALCCHYLFLVVFVFLALNSIYQQADQNYWI